MFDPGDGHVGELVDAAVEERVHPAHRAHVRRVLNICSQEFPPSAFFKLKKCPEYGVFLSLTRQGHKNFDFKFFSSNSFT